MRPVRSPALIIAVSLLLLPILYVGSYLALAVPEGIERERIVREPAISPSRIVFVSKNRYLAHYRFGGDWAESFYAPLSHIDQKLRPWSFAEFEDQLMDIVPADQSSRLTQ